MNEKNWLPHLTNEMVAGARNNNLCSYLIALEGWRRGLTLKFYSKLVKQNSLHAPGLLFTLDDGKNIKTFYKSKGMDVKGKAFSIGGNKIKSKQLLGENDIPVPKGKIFKGENDEKDIIKFANIIGYPVVVKPSNAAQGKGVITNIENENYLKDTLRYVRNELGYKEIILEQCVKGEEFRVYVVKDKVISVLNRIPANVTGDGKHTIKELIKIKNKERKENPRLYNCMIKMDFEIKNILQKNNYQLESILPKGEQLFLRTKSNTSAGGDSMDVTESFPENIKELAIRTLKIIPNFPHGAVDLMIDFKNDGKHIVNIIELTPVPQIGSAVFPMVGKGRDYPAAIIDYYFPNTIDKRNANANFYFDLNNILTPLMNRSASEVCVSPCPQNIGYQRKLILEGKVQGVGFRRFVRRKALEHNLYGYVLNRSDGRLEIVVSG